MEFIIGLAMKFWQWTVLIAVVIIAAVINFTDKRAKTKMKFNFKGFPEPAGSILTNSRPKPTHEDPIQQLFTYFFKYLCNRQRFYIKKN